MPFLRGLTVSPYKLTNNAEYPNIVADARSSLMKLRGMHADVLLAAHGFWFDLAGKAADLASPTLCGHRLTIASHGYPQPHAGHVIVVVLQGESVCQGVGDRHLGRVVGNEVAVKKPVTWRGIPLHSHRSASVATERCGSGAKE